MKSTKQIMSEFKKTQALWKKYCDEGKCTKEEATYAILGACQKALLDCKMPETKTSYDKFYGVNTYNVQNFN